MYARNPFLRQLLPYKVFLLLFFLPFFLSAQNLENIGNQPLQISGGLRLSNNFYTSTGIASRRDALQWRAIANLNLSFNGVSAPFSLAFSDGNQEFGLPSYTFAGISPSYKWATLHLGDRHLNYSKYTLNGINFRGAGFELEPGKFYVSGMYGRLRRARAEDLNSQQMLEPSYNRIGYGLNVGYRGDKGSEYSLIYFAAEDDETSITQPIATAIAPGNNAVISAIAKQKIVKNLKAELEFAHSVSNTDLRGDELIDADQNTANNLFGLFNPNQTVQDGNAYRAKLIYNPKALSLQTGYERIERGFRTMGSLFFLNDAEYFTAGLSKAFFENKLTLFANGGIERTNLDDYEKNGTRRLVGSVNLSYVPNEKWFFSGAYSNFENTTRLRTFTDPNLIVDSILLAQVTQTTNLVTSRNFLNQENPSAITFVLSYQAANSIINDEVQNDAKSTFFNGSLMYNYTRSLSDLRFTAAISYNQTELAQFDNNTFSPTLGITKGFWERKLQTTFRATYSLVNQEQLNSTSNVLNLTIGASYAFWEDHSLAFTTSFINRTSDTGSDIPSFRELYGRISYGYRFGGNLNLLR